MTEQELMGLICPLPPSQPGEPDPFRPPPDARLSWPPGFLEEDGVAGCLSCYQVLQISALRKPGVPQTCLCGPVDPARMVPMFLLDWDLGRLKRLSRALTHGTWTAGKVRLDEEDLIPHLRRMVQTWAELTQEGADLKAVRDLERDGAALTAELGVPDVSWARARALELWAWGMSEYIPSRALVSVGQAWWRLLSPSKTGQKVSEPVLLGDLRRLAWQVFPARASDVLSNYVSEGGLLQDFREALGGLLAGFAPLEEEAEARRELERALWEWAHEQAGLAQERLTALIPLTELEVLRSERPALLRGLQDVAEDEDYSLVQRALAAGDQAGARALELALICGERRVLFERHLRAEDRIKDVVWLDSGGFSGVFPAGMRPLGLTVAVPKVSPLEQDLWEAACPVWSLLRPEYELQEAES